MTNKNIWNEEFIEKLLKSNFGEEMDRLTKNIKEFDRERKMVFIHVDREFVERKDIKPMRKWIKSIEKKGVQKEFFQSLTITFNGYDDDVRELFEIDEVRKWTRKLLNQHPEILYYLNFSFEAHLILLKNYFDMTTMWVGEAKTIEQYINAGEDVPQYAIKFHPNKEELVKLLVETTSYANNLDDEEGANYVLGEMTKVFGGKENG